MQREKSEAHKRHPEESIVDKSAKNLGPRTINPNTTPPAGPRSVSRSHVDELCCRCSGNIVVKLARINQDAAIFETPLEHMV